MNRLRHRVAARPIRRNARALAMAVMLVTTGRHLPPAVIPEPIVFPRLRLVPVNPA